MIVKKILKKPVIYQKPIVFSRNGLYSLIKLTLFRTRGWKGKKLSALNHTR